MSKMSDFFKTKSGLAIKAAMTSAMAVNVANAASDVTTFDERAGYENSSVQKLVKMKERKIALDEVIHEMNLRVAHCNLVATKLMDAFSEMRVVQEARSRTPLEKLSTIGKMADDALNAPVKFNDFAESMESAFESAEANERLASASDFLNNDEVDRGTYVEINPEELKSSAAAVLDRTTNLIGALQDDLDVCVGTVATMVLGYSNIGSHENLPIDDPEYFLAANLEIVSQAYGVYSEYMEHSYMKRYAEVMDNKEREEGLAEEIETPAGMKL